MPDRSLAYRQCSVSVLDTIDDPSMRFDAAGRSHYFHQYHRDYAEHVREGEEGRKQLARMVDRIVSGGKGKSYDCVIGLSGGVDSTYLASLAVRLGLRPLAVHFDNGWNSETSVRNVENTVNRLGLDLHTVVVEWSEFRDLQLAYLRASVVDVEVPTDHAIAASLHRLAVKHGVRFMLSGSNVVTESVLPPHWIFNKLDHVNLLDINRTFGSGTLRTYPLFGTFEKKTAVDLLGIRSVSLLNLVDYKYEEAKAAITRELDWRDYGGKHHESIFTRFYQCCILPAKFGIDKRKAHLSNLIFSGQLDRSAALDLLLEPPCSAEVMASDREFVLKKLGLGDVEFDRMMAATPRSHEEFKTEVALSKTIPGGVVLRPFWRLAKVSLEAIRRMRPVRGADRD